MKRRAPAGVVAILAALALTLLGLPVATLVARVPWSTLGSTLTAPALRSALRLSLVCSLTAAVLSVLLGVPVAWVLARWRLPARAVVRAIVLLPLVLPPVVGGVALLLAFGRRGLLGGALGALGIRLPFTTAGAIVAETFVAMPFLVISAEAAFRNVDPRLEEAARTLGAGSWLRFRRVVLPACWPALGAGAVLAWARALGEFGATITFAGNTPGRTTTIPLQVYVLLESGELRGAIVLSAVLVGVCAAVLVALRERWVTAL